MQKEIIDLEAVKLNKTTLWYLKARKLAFNGLWEFLLKHKSFFLKSDFSIVMNIHTSNDEGIGTYIVHKDFFYPFFCTDDHKTYYKTMQDCYDFIEQVENLVLTSTDKQSLLKNNWHLIFDKETKKFIALTGYNDAFSLFRGGLDPQHYSVEEFSKYNREDPHHDRIAHYYYKEEDNPLYIKGIEYMRYRFEIHKVDLETAFMFLSTNFNDRQRESSENV